MPWVFNFVNEPKFSKNILLNLQKKYQENTLEVVALLKEGQLPSSIGEKDLQKWILRYRVFIVAGGDISELNQVI